MDTAGEKRREDYKQLSHVYFERWLLSVEALMNERDRRYEDKFKALDSATEKALAAVREQTTAAFQANEKAITKAEEAQRSYNERSNEFRGQLDDQAKRLMPREEALTKFAVYDEKIEEIKREIVKLRESQMESGGRRVQQQENKQQSNFTVSQVITVIFGLLGVLTFALALVQFFFKKP